MAVKQLVAQLIGPALSSIRSAIPFAAIALLIYYAIIIYKRRDTSGVPVVGWISPIQPRVAALWYFLKQNTLLDIAYTKYLKHGNPCKIPDFVFGPSIVLLPISELKWVISQPPTVLDYTFTQDDVVRTAEVLWNGENPYNKGEFLALGFPALWISKRFNGPKNTIYRAVQNIIGRMWDSEDGEWRVVNPTDTVFNAVKQAVYASYLGYENSYVPEIWETGQTMADGVFIADYLARCVPKFLRWQALWVTGWQVRRLHAKFRAWLVPLVAKRIAVLSANVNDYDHEEPSLLDSLILDEIERHEKPGQPFPPVAQERIVRLITGLIFSATQTTSIAGSRTLDLLIRTASEEVRRQIRTEVEAPEASLVTGGAITKNSLNHLATLDSSLRESMRMWPVENTTPIRTLLVDHVFDLNGRQYPAKTGQRISFASINVMNDPNIFENPTVFDPMRFARMKKDDEGRNAYSALGYEYLAWGHGKTACPGRQLASDILKLALAEMFLKYEMKPEKEGGKMESVRMGPFLPPDRSRNFLVTRRKE